MTDYQFNAILGLLYLLLANTCDTRGLRAFWSVLAVITIVMNFYVRYFA